MIHVSGHDCTNSNYVFQLGVCGTNLVSPGWLVLGVTVDNVQ